MIIETYTDGKLVSTETGPDVPKSADAVAFAALREKILASTATPDEVREALKLLMRNGML